MAGLLAAWAGGIGAAAALALFVGLAASSGKLAFDSVVQRDAPDANRGRSFARFETRFQLMWVVGAFIPVVITIPIEIGFLVIAAAAAFAVLSYLAGLRGLARGEVPVRRRPTEVITSRLRRRPPGLRGRPRRHAAARRRRRHAAGRRRGRPTTPDALTSVEPSRDRGGARPGRRGPTSFDEPVRRRRHAGPASRPAAGLDEASTTSRPRRTGPGRGDRRVVIDPTNL